MIHGNPEQRVSRVSMVSIQHMLGGWTEEYGPQKDIHRGWERRGCALEKGLRAEMVIPEQTEW